MKRTIGNKSHAFGTSYQRNKDQPRLLGMELSKNFSNTTEFYNHAKKFFEIETPGNTLKIVGLKESYNISDDKLFENYHTILKESRTRKPIEERLLEMYKVAAIYLDANITKSKRELEEKENNIEKNQILTEMLKTYHVLNPQRIEKLKSVSLDNIKRVIVRESIDEYIESTNYQDEFIAGTIRGNSQLRQNGIYDTLTETTTKQQLIELSKLMNTASKDYKDLSNYVKEGSLKIGMSIVDNINEIPRIKEQFTKETFNHLNHEEQRALRWSGKIEDIIKHLTEHADWNEFFANTANHPQIISYSNEYHSAITSPNAIPKYLTIMTNSDVMNKFDKNPTPENMVKLEKEFAPQAAILIPRVFTELFNKYLTQISKQNATSLHPRILNGLIYAISNNDQEIINKLEPYSTLARMYNDKHVD